MDTLTFVFSAVLAFNTFYIDPVVCCDFAGLGQCNDILVQYGAEGLSKGVSTMPYGEQYRLVCRAFKTFGECYKPKYAQCGGNPSLALAYGTIENTINYICKDGQKEIESYEWCWKKPEVTRLSQKCADAQNKTAQNIQYQAQMGQMSQHNVKKRMCEMMTESSSCFENAIFSKCGAGPDCTMQTLLNRGFKLLREMMSCSRPESCRQSSAGVVHVTFVVSLLVPALVSIRQLL